MCIGQLACALDNRYNSSSQTIMTIVVTNYVMCVRWTNCYHSCWTIVTNDATAQKQALQATLNLKGPPTTPLRISLEVGNDYQPIRG